MPVPTLITDLSTTVGSNSPAGTETPTDGDNYIRVLSAFLASIRDNTGNGWTSPYATAASLASYLPLAGGTVSGNLAINGNATLGDAAADSVTVNGTPSGLLLGSNYTPSLVAVANVSGITSNQAQYIRVGPIVIVSGLLSCTETSVATKCRIAIPFPIASAITSAQQCSGSGGVQPSSATAYRGLYVLGDATNDRAEINWDATGSGTAVNISYVFMYTVV